VQKAQKTTKPAVNLLFNKGSKSNQNDVLLIDASRVRNKMDSYLKELGL
jgi:hypothetical protein